MTRFSKMIAMLAGTASLAGLAATGADAQRRNREAPAAEAAAPQASRAFVAAYQPIQPLLSAQNWTGADALLPAIKAAATSDYERYLASRAELSIALGLNDNARQIATIGAIVDSPAMPVAEQARLLTLGAQLAYNADDYAVAAARAKRALAAGATADNLTLMVVDANIRANQLDVALTEGRAIIAAAQANGGKAPEQVYAILARALQEADRNDELMDMLVARVAAYPTADNIRTSSLIYIQNSPEDRGTTIDVLRLMAAADAMTDRRYYVEYASSLAEDALPNEALQAIAAGRAAGLISAKPAGADRNTALCGADVNFCEIEQTANANLAEDRASLAGGERRAAAAAEARLATRVADAYLSYGDYPKAEELYTLALTKSGADAGLINTRLGITRYRAGNLTGALEAFGRVEGVRTGAARLWTAFIQSKTSPAAAPPASPATPAPTAG